jgi:hypothetical protein
MKKLLLITAFAFLLFSCSNDSDSTTEPTQEVKNYNNLTFLDATYEKLNVDGNQLPISVGDAVTVFERTTDIQITNTTFETNTIAPVAYYKSGFTYSLPSLTQFIFYEDSRIIIKKIEYPTSYGKDKRSERYSY